ncbi:hypothetical protein TELCIR_12808 [Teladorsagia circumcincta]|uniref:Uncharacterized protein n=1 Tax=Teladorsagia circumcincta TaxID=45464 RepID=A0A2G9U5M2_TELCI|nr:hypothetical protein TELCIR_12808 [Teladorsagia circumcincta]
MGLFDLAMFDELRRMNVRQLIYQGLNFAMVVSSALMIWKGLMVVTGSESPIVTLAVHVVVELGDDDGDDENEPLFREAVDNVKTEHEE